MPPVAAEAPEIHSLVERDERRRIELHHRQGLFQCAADARDAWIHAGAGDDAIGAMGLGKAQNLAGHIPLAQGHGQLQQAFVEEADAFEADRLGRPLGIGGGGAVPPQQFTIKHEHGRLIRMRQKGGVAGARRVPV